jgi:hypothetical protein
MEALPHGRVLLVPVLVASLAVPTFVAFWIGGRPEAGLLETRARTATAMALIAALAALNRRS